MAAVLCKSMGSLCSSCGECITLPFRACGKVCGAACENCVKVFASPFTPYILTTLALNLPPVIWGLRSVVNQFQQQQFDCHGERWLWTYAVLSFIHIVASIYISSRIQDSSNDDHDDDYDGYDEHMDGVKVELPMATTGTQNASVAKASATAPPPPPMQAPYHAYEESMDEAEKGSGSTMKNTAAQAASTLVRIATAASAAFPPSNNNNTNTAHRAAPVAVAAFDTTDDGRAGKSNSIQRLKQVLCYDVGVALYILVVIFWFVWQSYGISQVLFAPRNDYDNDSEICNSVGTWVILSIMCGFLYIMLVCVAFACSFLCLRY